MGNKKSRIPRTSNKLIQKRRCASARAKKLQKQQDQEAHGARPPADFENDNHDICTVNEPMAKEPEFDRDDKTKHRSGIVNSRVNATCSSKRLMELAAEYSCLSDPGDLNYNDITMRAICRQQLLNKFNSQSSVQITMQDLVRKLNTMKRWKRRNNSKMKKQHESGKGHACGSIIRETRDCSGVDQETEESTSSSSFSHDTTPSSRNLLEMLLQTNDYSPSSGSIEFSEDQNDSQYTTEDGARSHGDAIRGSGCSFCGTVAPEYMDVTNEKPYFAENKTVLKLNDINVEVNFNSTVQKVCGTCDTKLLGIHDFLQLVKEAQAKLENVDSIINYKICPSPMYDASNYDNNDGEFDQKNGIWDTLEFTDTEFIGNSIVNKGKCDDIEISPKRKRRKVKNKNTKLTENNDVGSPPTSDDNENDSVSDVKYDVRNTSFLNDINMVAAREKSTVSVKNEICGDNDTVSEPAQHMNIVDRKFMCINEIKQEPDIQ